LNGNPRADAYEIAGMLNYQYTYQIGLSESKPRASRLPDEPEKVFICTSNPIVALSENSVSLRADARSTTREMFSTARRRALREVVWSTVPNEAEYIEAWKFSNITNLFFFALLHDEARANKL
jgi:hypothetical protein